MASQISIANNALIKVGAKRINALTDDVEAAEIIQAHWDDWRDDELRRKVWRFSVRRASLPADADAPEWGFDAQYTQPSGCLRIIQVSDLWVGPDLSYFRGSETAPWLIEGGKILTDIANGGALKIRYIKQISTVGDWDASFAHAFSCRLAMELSERLTESTAKFEKCEGWYREAISAAARANALENPSRPVGDDTWLASRIQV